MQNSIPSWSNVMRTLLRADFTTQWRNRRAAIIMLITPVIILFSWKSLVAKLGGSYVLSTCITIGLMGIGLMGYSNSIARDRDKGIFQRLRVAPIYPVSIMSSRLLVQWVMILLSTSIVFFAGAKFDHINLTPAAYALGFIAALVGGTVYLGLGQAIVGLIKNAETVNSTTRLVYFVFILVGIFADLGALGQELDNAVKWSPYGTVKQMLNASLQPSLWNQQTSIALLVTLGYALVFSTLGIKRFTWK
ncbi:MAG TPA: ABC transporter permease [Chitinophagaceae bacterium]|nr:ABC transporter permease [Chitinophagaceae bacterium]